MVTADAEDFAETGSYHWLWGQIRQLPGVNFDIDAWEDLTADNDSDPKMNVVVAGKPFRIELRCNAAHFDAAFIERLNEIIDQLKLSGNHFSNVSPEGVENNYGEVNIVFLPQETVSKLDANGYGVSEAKWFGI